MNFQDKESFLNAGCRTLEEMYDLISNLPSIKLSDFDSENSALVIIDVVNGFAKEGALASPRVDALIPEITKLAEKCGELDMQKIVFADSHSKDCPEFESFPVHCVAGTNEDEVVDEIKEIGGYNLIRKNSTNGFHEEEFQSWLKDNSHIDTFIVTGDCTDICISQFTITLKAWFNKLNKKARIVVPLNTIDTYDIDVHSGDFINIVTAYNMMISGIEIVSGIDC